MRIVGHIEHPQLKITLFQMDNKLSVKLESGLYEQTYKFRMGEHLSNAEDLKRLVDETFIEGVLQELATMHKIRNQAMGRFLPPEPEDTFDEII